MYNTTKSTTQINTYISLAQEEQLEDIFVKILAHKMHASLNYLFSHYTNKNIKHACFKYIAIDDNFDLFLCKFNYPLSHYHKTPIILVSGLNLPRL